MRRRPAPDTVAARHAGLKQIAGIEPVMTVAERRLDEVAGLETPCQAGCNLHETEAVGTLRSGERQSLSRVRKKSEATVDDATIESRRSLSRIVIARRPRQTNQSCDADPPKSFFRNLLGSSRRRDRPNCE